MIEFLIIFLAYPAGLIIRKIAKEDYDSFLQIFSKILLIVIFTIIFYRKEVFKINIHFFDKLIIFLF